MPSKKQHESNVKQAARFRSEAQKLIDAGELNPTDAEAAMNSLMRKVASQSPR